MNNRPAIGFHRPVRDEFTYARQRFRRVLVPEFGVPRINHAK